MELPTKRITGDTLEERLTDNAYSKILPSRYLERDADGELIETQEELFDRVAKNLAIPEAIHPGKKVWITKDVVKEYHLGSDEIDDVFGRDDKVQLSESNAKYVDHDRLVDYLQEEGYRDALEQVEKKTYLFRDLMETLSFIPNSPNLMNAGGELQQLSACFVDSPDDDMNDIHDTAREAALTFQSGGGMGYSFSNLRPYGDQVGSTGGIASGPITFMRTFDQMTETIAQGGKRRGAQMGVMRVTHPDIIHFIHAKDEDVSLSRALRLNDPKDPQNASLKEALEEAREILRDNNELPNYLRNAIESHLSNFNISVAVTDEFMNAMKSGDDYELINPRTGEVHIATEETKEMYELFGMGEYVEVGEPLELPAEVIWDRIIEGAHSNGEPGVVYIDRIHKEHSFPAESTPSSETGEYEILGTNPCGEQPLMEYESCNLGHLNLSTVARTDRELWPDFNGNINEYVSLAVDWEELERRIGLAVRFLDNAVTMSDFPVDEMEEVVSNNRKIGLGIMGLAELFIQLGIEYGSEAGNKAAEHIMTYINRASKEASHQLADEKGVFPNWEDSKWSDPKSYPEWFRKHTDRDPENFSDGYLMRNHNTTSIAPTGTTSMIGNTSAGCEPLMNVAYMKNVGQDVQGDEMLAEFNDYFARTLEANDIDVETVKAEVEDLMAKGKFSGPKDLESVPDEIAELFITSGDLTGPQHARVQTALQEGVDSAISKTINAPNEATVEDTSEAFEIVYDEGGKGVTYYRDGSRSKQVVTTDTSDQNETEDEEVTTSDGNGHKPRERPKTIEGSTERINTGYGKMYVTINEDDEGLFEVFATVGKSGGFTESMVEGLAREISLALRVGADVDEVIDQIDDIRSPETYWDRGDQVRSIPDGIALALKRYTGSEGSTDDTVPSPSIGDGGHEKKSDSGIQELIKSGDSPECQECGALVEFKEGCQTCPVCGWSKCD